MKIGIITFHFVTNQGAVLQCYALQTYLEKLGHTVSIINYQPAYHMVRYAAWKNPFVFSLVRWRQTYKLNTRKRLFKSFLSFLAAMKANIKRVDVKKEKIFKTFTDQYLHMTDKYTTLDSLKDNFPQMDVYISGSDQLWNPILLDGGFDPAYFLDFGNDKIFKMTYAVSLKETYSNEETKQLGELCKHLNAIGIREDNSDLENSIEQSINIQVDPTLLLDSADYKRIECQRLVDEPYIFVYGFQNLKSINRLVCEISEKNNLKVINGSPNKVLLTCQCNKVYNYGPSEFLSYVKNAEFIVTNSFHGTAFSIIYRKQFAVIPHTTRGKRMIRLLGKLGLSKRLWKPENFNWWEKVDYSTVEEKLSLLRNESYQYLHNNLALAKSKHNIRV